MTRSFRIEVWAPLADTISAVAGALPETLQRDPERPGWWVGEHTHPPGTRYGFFPPGIKDAIPDPRSAYQPDGIHGLSCFVDHASFEWMDFDWQPPEWETAVIYELHVGTFTEDGTFDSTVRRLPELLGLGVTHIELLPICEFPGSRGWGYDCVSIFAPHHAYGGPDGLKRFVNACHDVGLAVILDVVYNHMGPDGNYLPSFGPYFTDQHITPWGRGPNLDDDHCEGARQFFIDNALMWLRDYHVDGLRLDAADHIKDNSEKHFLAELKEAVAQLDGETGRRHLLIAESAADDPIFVQPLSEGGYGLDAIWNDEFHHSLRTTFTGENEGYYIDFGRPGDLAKAMKQAFVYDGVYSEFRGKVHGKSPEGISPARFLAYLQTHDQVGNRAQGDRFHHHPESSMLAQKVGAALVILSPYIPMLFMGEEWAASTPFLFFTDHVDPELATAVSDGRRKEFGGNAWDGGVPDPQEMGTFLASKLPWDEREIQAHRDMLDWYRALIKLRKSRPELAAGASPHQVSADPEGKWIYLDRGNVRVACSLVKSHVRFDFPPPDQDSVLLESGKRSDIEGFLGFEGLGVIVFEQR